MGCSYEVSCPNCGYQARSSCGRDAGFIAVVETYTCEDCRELTDVLIGKEGRIVDRSRLTAAQKKKYYRCTKCGSTKSTAWDPEVRPCPKCGTKLSKSEEPDIMWD